MHKMIRIGRLPAVGCALAVLVSLLVAHPFVDVGVLDDWSYVYTAQQLAATGHIHYAWASPILGWQLYPAALLFKLFGFSFSLARSVTWGVAMSAAFLLQRIVVRFGVSERNAAIATLSLVLSPLFLMLSSVYMTDIPGFFAILVCLYCCLRALQASTDHASANWICSAAVASAALGTCRQIAWLGLLVMVPCTLWLIRKRRGVVRLGTLSLVLSLIFILGVLHWFQQQPWVLPERIIPPAPPYAGVPPSLIKIAAHIVRQLAESFLEMPLLLLPLSAAFLFRIRSARKPLLLVLLAAAVLYTGLGWHFRHSHPEYLLEPTAGNWLGVHAYIEAEGPLSHGPIVLGLYLRVLLTVLSIGGLLGIIATASSAKPVSDRAITPANIPWRDLLVILLPFTLVYGALLVPRSVTELFDRYLIGLLILPLVCITRLYQERVQSNLPISAILLLMIVASYSICCVHNTFAQTRAITSLDNRIVAAGLPRNEVDFGWSYDSWIEVNKYGHINDPNFVVPKNAFVPIPDTVDPSCYIPDIKFQYLRPIYGISFDPRSCLGSIGLAPATYSTWPTGKTAEIYVVRYTPLRAAPSLKATY